MDAALMSEALVNFHPLENTATTAIAPDDLRRFLDAVAHPPQVLDLGEAESGVQ